jgi:signal transduction histidine kinase
MAWLDRSIRLDSDAARRMQEDIIANIQGGFVIVDAHGAITLSNRRFDDMVGGPAKDTPITGFFSPESANEYSQQLTERGGFEFAGRLRDKRGTLRPVIITSAPLTFRGDRNKRMLIFIDSARLEQTIARKFLNIFSHALKSPVHSIILIADLFRRKNAVAKFDHYYSQLEQKVREFTALTDNVLRFSTLDIKEISVNKVSLNVAGVLRSVLAAAGERAKARGLLLKESVAGELRTAADPDLLRIVFNNLLDNALKYTPSGAITVETHDLGTTIRIVVADTGPGVRSAEREDIFDLFVQGARQSDSSREGLGLGLYISRRYVEAMGGRLWYEPVLAEGSPPGEDELLAGSRFVVELPS